MKLKKTTIFILLIFVTITLIKAQEKKDPYLNTQTPHNTIYTHIKSLQKADYNINRAVKTFDIKSNDEKYNQKIANKLQQIYKGKGLVINYDKLPKDANYVDTNTGEHKYIPFKNYSKIYLIKKGNEWLYSNETVKAIPKIYKEIYPLGKDFISSLFPQKANNKVMGMFAWQLYGLLIILIIIFMLYKIFNWIFNFILYRMIKKFFSPEIAHNVILPVSRPLSLLIISLILLALFPILQFTAEIIAKVNIIIRIAISVFGMLIFYKFVDVLGEYMKKAADKTKSKLDDQLVPLVTKALKVFVVILGIIFILQNFGLKITGLLAGLSIGGLALALAAQDTLKNFFGSVMIFLDKPFHIGDWIVAGDVDGTVEEVGFRSTRIRTFQNSLITIPNAKLTNDKVDNMGLRVYRRLSTHIAITYDTPPDKIESFIDGIRGIIKVHPHTRKDFYIVELHEMADYSLNILLYMFFKAETWNLELKYRNEILLSIIKLAEQLEVRFAFPTQTQFIEEFPGKPSLSPKHSKTKNEQRQIVASFINKMKQTQTIASRSEHQRKQYKQAQKPQQQHQKHDASTHQKQIQKQKQQEQPQKQKQQEQPQKQKQEPKQKKQLLKKKHERPSKPIIEKEDNLTSRAVKKGKEITKNEIIDIAKGLKIEENALKAIIEVETKAKGFYSDGKPTIVFEGQRFWKELLKKNIDPEQYKEKYPEIVYSRWTKKYFKKDQQEYERLEKAKTIDKEAAYLATSWGRFKVTGSRYKQCGFNSLQEFVYKQYQTEKEQLETIASLIKTLNIVNSIREHDWKAFARKFNGPNYARGNFHIKLEKAYKDLQQ
ncbi:MAG: mechanosensitive ion channel, partial [Bacteroidota bacterium]|nr:mechanosensitive ion channel [Bacteroidota bacterium]